MKKNLVLTFLILTLGLTMQAQDQHFTQFYAAPLTLNPGLTGAFNGRYRAAFIYRDQWRKLLDNPYSTFAASADVRIPLKLIRSRSKDAVGVGVLFYNDRVPVIDFSTNQMILSLAYHKSLSPKNDHFLSLGAQAGIAQRNVNYENLFFEDQFNGLDGFYNVSGETLPENNFSYSDYSVGLSYTYAPEQKLGVYAGFAMFHLLEPEQSFYYDPDRPDNSPTNTLLMKYVAHLGLTIPIGSGVQIQPRGLVYSQGPHLAMNAGTNFRFLLSKTSSTALHLGGWARPVSGVDNKLTMDAVVLMTGIEMNNFLIGFSYDLNLDALNTAGSKQQSAFEISVAYLGQYEDDTVLCPKF